METQIELGIGLICHEVNGVLSNMSEENAWSDYVCKWCHLCYRYVPNPVDGKGSS